MEPDQARTHSKPLMHLSGWEAFMNGVFAIAVTLLVLDIRVPDYTTIDSGSALVDAIWAQGPRYVAYILGFMYMGEYWLSTNRTLHLMRGVDHWFLVIGLLFLMVLAAVPFGTALLAEYIGLGNGRDQVALVVFVSLQLALALLANVLIRYAAHDGRLLRPNVSKAGLRIWLRVVAFGPVVWFVALLSAIFVSGAVTLALMAVLVVVFMMDVPTGELPEEEPA